MAAINVQDLRPVGATLFVDSESYLNELNTEELGQVQGGLTPTVTSSPYCAAAAGALFSAGLAWAADPVN